MENELISYRTCLTSLLHYTDSMVSHMHGMTAVSTKAVSTAREFMTGASMVTLPHTAVSTTVTTSPAVAATVPSSLDHATVIESVPGLSRAAQTQLDANLRELESLHSANEQTVNSIELQLNQQILQRLRQEIDQVTALLQVTARCLSHHSILHECCLPKNFLSVLICIQSSRSSHSLFASASFFPATM